MKILYFSYLDDIIGISAGSANKAIGLLNGLEQLGHETYICWRGYQPSANKRSTYLKKNLFQKFYSKYLHEPKLLMQNVKHLIQERKIINEKSPDVIISRLTLYGASSLILSKLYKIPFVIEADCPPIYENNTFYGKDNFHLDRTAEFIERQNLLKSDAVIFLSNILKEYYVKKGIPEDRAYVIPNGADPDKFKPLPENQKLASQLNINDKIVIGWIGSLHGEWSGLAALIEMALRISECRHDVQFLFVGGGSNKERIEKAFGARGHSDQVILPGTIPYDNIPEFLSLMDIVIAPYPKLDFWYPSSMKVFEYMASGKAVVASDVGQVGEVITHEYDGLLYDAEVKDDMINKVNYLIEKPEIIKRLGENARKTVLNKYTWKNHAQGLERIICGII